MPVSGVVSTAPNGVAEFRATEGQSPDDVYREAHALAQKHDVTVSIVVDGVRATFEPLPATERPMW